MKEEEKTIEIKYEANNTFNEDVAVIENNFVNVEFMKAFRTKRVYTTAPAFSPTNFFESIQYYDDGSARRVYFYFNDTWSYTTLT